MTQHPDRRPQPPDTPAADDPDRRDDARVPADRQAPPPTRDSGVGSAGSVPLDATGERIPTPSRGDDPVPPMPGEEGQRHLDVPEGTGPDESLADTVKAQTRSVAEDVKRDASDVARHTVEQAREVAGEVQDRTRELLRETRAEVTRQANTGQVRVAAGLHTLSDELRSMANGPQEGPATDLARMLSVQLGRAAEFLDRRDVGDVMDQVRDFARRRPGAYLAGAAAAGVAAGRMTRAVRHDASPIDADEGDRQPTGEFPPVTPAETHFRSATQPPVDSTGEVGRPPAEERDLGRGHSTDPARGPER